MDLRVEVYVRYRPCGASWVDGKLVRDAGWTTSILLPPYTNINKEALKGKDAVVTRYSHMLAIDMPRKYNANHLKKLLEKLTGGEARLEKKTVVPPMDVACASSGWDYVFKVVVRHG